MDRRQRVLDLVRPAGRRGIEMGPLTRPSILRSDGEVLYADHASSADLRRKYEGHSIPGGIEAIVDVDLVLDGRPLAEILGRRGPVDYVVASHVIEHVADPVGWLLDAAAVLGEGGAICLVVPDKRLTFDHSRAPTKAADLVGWHLAGLRRPSPAQVYDYFVRAHPVNPFAVWRSRPIETAPSCDPEKALSAAREIAASENYIDVHCSVFTPFGFAEVFRELIATGLLPLTVETLEPTRRDELEFFVLFRKSARLSPAERALTMPRLDRARHDALPRPSWPVRLARAARSWRG